VLAWTAACYVTTRIAVRRELRLIPLLGVIVGVGLEAKYTIAFLGAALVVAFAVFDREVLRGSRPWIAAGIALLLIAPNLAWQARHGWPSVHFASSQNAKTAEDTPPPVYVAQQVLFLAGSIVLAVAGVAWLWRRRLRALAAIPVLLTLVFLAERGRAYYALPADSIAVAAGAVHATLERLESKGLLASRLGSGTPVRAGRPRRYYRLQPAGIRALNDARAAVDTLWDGLKWPLIKARAMV